MPSTLPQTIQESLQTGDESEVLAATLTHFQCAAGTIHWLNQATNLLELGAHKNLPPLIVDLVKIVPVGKGIAGIAAERREPVSLCNLQTDNSGTAKPAAKSTGMEGSLAVPMLKGDVLSGVIGIAKAQAHDWTRDETALLLKIGAAIAEGTSFKS